MGIPTCRFGDTDASGFYHGLIPAPPAGVPSAAQPPGLEPLDALVPLVAIASAHKWLRSETRLSIACLTSSGLSGVVSRAVGVASTEGYKPAAGDEDDDEEHPDVSRPAARQIAIAASPLAVTQLRPCMWAYPRCALAKPPVGLLKDRHRLAFPLSRYNVYQSKNHQEIQVLRKEPANNRVTL
jgi:hypothetical protein